MTEYDCIIGKTPAKVEVQRGGEFHEDRIIMTLADGGIATWYHYQDCCENVSIEDINGDFDDLLGHPLLVVEERSTESEDEWGHKTWTFYTFRSLGGSVDVRWYGSSNGYYSEKVDFKFEERQTEDA